jgi:hypothetical protein
MGSHFSQCFASHQTIAPGDKCYALAIRQQSTYDTVEMTHKGKKHKALGISNSAIYPDAYWTPVGNFIEGVYRIGGDIDILENDENIRRMLVFVKLMLKDAAVIAEGEDPSQDLPFNLREYITGNAPFLSGYLKKAPASALTDVRAHELFNELAKVWRHIDDVAFKHRVFYADGHGRMRPLQFTLMHKRCYDDLLGQVGEAHSPNALFEQGLDAVKALESLNTVGSTKDISALSREMYASVAASAFIRRTTRIGTFEDIDYHEEELGFGEFILKHLEGTLTKSALLKRTEPVMKDRLVVHLLEDYKIKLAPKCIWHEDGKNAFGKAYADFVSRVSISVTKGRRNKRSY